MPNHPNALDIPPVAASNDESAEMLRAWVAEEALHCVIRADAWSESGNWGILLADVARHVANATEELHGIPAQTTIEQIRSLFDAELENPTDEPTGDFAE